MLVDDGKKNIDAVKAAADAAGVTYLGLHYTRIQKPLPLPAGAADKVTESANAWKQLSAFLGAVFPVRLQEMAAGHCSY